MVGRDERRAIRTGPYDDAADWIDDVLMSSVAAIVADAGGPPRTTAGFAALRDRVRDDLADLATGVGRESLELLATIEDVEDALGPLADRYPEVAADVAEQVNRLVYPGFLQGVGAGRVADVARYLLAVLRRLEALPQHPERDAAAMAEVRALEAEYERLADLLPVTPESLEIAWMLQELRVSRFAQAVGTRGKVSEQRIRRAMAALEGL